MNQANKASHFLLFLIVAAGGQCLARGQNPRLWHDMKPQFVLKGSHEPLSQPLVPTAVCFLDDLVGWAVGSDGGWQHRPGLKAQTRDGGTLWEVEFAPEPSEFSDVFFLSPERGWIVGNKTSPDNDLLATLLETNDGGKTWREQKTGTALVRGGFESISFANEERGYIAGGAMVAGHLAPAIFRTLDGGKKWNLVYLGQQKGALNCVRFARGGEVGWAVGDGGTILNSRDRGKTWHKQRSDFDGILFAIAVVDEREAWITGSHNALLHSIDAGITWKVFTPAISTRALGEFSMWFSGILFIDKIHGWVSGSNGVVLGTEDGGINWRVETFGVGEFLYGITLVNTHIIAIGKESTLLRRDL